MAEAHSCPFGSWSWWRFYSRCNRLFSLSNSVTHGSNCSLVAPYQFYFVWGLVNTREMAHQILLHPKEQKLPVFGYFLYLVLFLMVFPPSFSLLLDCVISFLSNLFLHWFASSVFLLYNIFRSQHNVFSMIA